MQRGIRIPGFCGPHILYTTVNKKPDIYGRMYNTRLCCEALFFTAYTEALGFTLFEQYYNAICRPLRPGRDSNPDIQIIFWPCAK